MKTPKPHQQAIIDLISSNPLALHPCGAGKTLTGVLAAKRAQEKDAPHLPILVVTKKLTRWQWEQTINEMYPADEVYILTEKHKGKINAPIWIITHYEHLIRNGGVLNSSNFACIIADEVHKIKNRLAQRTKALKALRSVRRLGLTGTETSKDVSDLWSIYNWLHPEIFGERKTWTFRHFFDMFVDWEMSYSGYRIVNGPKNLDKLAQLSADFVHNIKREDINAVFPDIRTEYIPIELEGLQKSEYNKLRPKGIMYPDLETIDELFIRNQLVRIIRMQQFITDPLLLGSEAPSAKLIWCYEYVEDNPNTSILFFTRFKDTALRLAQTLHAAVLTGEHERGMQEFIAGKQRLCVATLGKASESLDLPDLNTIVFIDQTRNQIEMRQAADRFNRMGASGGKQLIYLLARNTIDERIDKARQLNQTDVELVRSAIRGGYI